jgi:signal peptidase I
MPNPKDTRPTRDQLKDRLGNFFASIHQPPADGLDPHIASRTAGMFKEIAELAVDVKSTVLLASPTAQPSPTVLDRVMAFANTAAFTGVAVAVLTLFSFVIFTRFQVFGASMAPAIYQDDHLAINQWVYSIDQLQRGDVVVIANIGLPDHPYIKRVVGLPGDTVEIIGGWLVVNDALIDEPYLGTPDGFDYPETIVPEGMIFVLGDNRRISEDSRTWGPVPIGDVIGRASFVYWPPAHIHLIEHYRSPLISE